MADKPLPPDEASNIRHEAGRVPMSSERLRGTAVRHGIDIDALDRMVEQGQKLLSLEEGIKRSRADIAADEGVTLGAVHMRARRRDNEDLRKKEKAGRTAQNEALRRLKARHPDEMLMIVQEVRREMGLPPLRPYNRGGKGGPGAPLGTREADSTPAPAETSPDAAARPTAGPAGSPVEPPPTPLAEVPAPHVALYPKSEPEQAACRHFTLKKLPYATVCAECGKRIR